MKQVFLLNYEPKFSDDLIEKCGFCPNSVMIFTDIDGALYTHEQICKSGRLAFIALAKEERGMLVNGEVLVEEPLDGYDRGLLKMRINPEKYHKVI